jgi:hypothetical protein
MDIKNMCEHIGYSDDEITISVTVPHEAKNLWLNFNQQCTPTRPQL